MKKYEVEGHAESYLPDGKEWKLIWHDEFDGTELDREKWDFRLHLFGKRHETFIEDGVTFDGKSNMMLHIIEKDGEYYSPHLQTGENMFDRPPDHPIWPIAEMKQPKFVHKYGYYEIRCKLQKQPGWWSAFWLQSPTIGAGLNPEKAGVEIDIMESFVPGTIVPPHLHWNGYGRNYSHMNTMFNKSNDNMPIPETQDGYHRFGVHWSREGYTFYMDGKVHGKLDGPVSDTEQFILVSTECVGYRPTGIPDVAEGAGKPVLPDCFVVDYVRVFDEAE